MMAHVGFKTLTRQFAARKSKKKISNPKALAAWIGRKKYGKAGMASKAVAGRRAAAKRRR